MTVAKNNFKLHIKQCVEAIKVYEYLNGKGYSADFGLRFVWVASASALDHYISELIIEKSIEHFANGLALSSKMQNESVSLSMALSMNPADPIQSIINFRDIISRIVRFRTFQKADDVADGLSFIWNEKHKWNKISNLIGLENKSARFKLNSIAYRRDAIAHNADYDELTQSLRSCEMPDAQKVVDYVNILVESIDQLVP